MGMREEKKIHQLLFGAALAERKRKLPPSSIIIAKTFLVKNETATNTEISKCIWLNELSSGTSYS